MRATCLGILMKFNHNRLRPKPSQKNTKHRIKPDVFKDKEYLHWLHNDRRPACALCGTPYNAGTELHHIRDVMVLGRDDSYVIPLCGVQCHRLGESSAHGGTRKFNELLSKDEQMEISESLYYEYITITKSNIYDIF